METIRSGAGTLSGGRKRNRAQAGLVIAQFTLSFALLAGAGLLLKSYRWLNRVDPGFEV
jgi:putative ABC transport system permease protein